MKTLLLICSIFIAGSINAQQISEADVPVAVLEKFNSMFSGEKNAGWEKEGGDYEVTMKLNNSESSLLFDAEGNLLHSENQISGSQLPEKVIEYLTVNLKAGVVEEASKIVDNNGKVTYKAEINGVDYLFSEDAKLLNNGTDDSEKSEYDSD